MWLKIYTDGSLKQRDGKQLVIGWGFVVVKDGKEVAAECGKFTGPADFISQRNIAGEIMAVRKAVDWAITEGYKKIRIYHDYLGCSAWVAGEWAANNRHTRDYKRFIEEKSRVIKIQFNPIKGHGKNKSAVDNRWNDRADVMAKQGCL